MRIKINGIKWEVLWVKDNDKKLFCDDTQCLGVTYFGKRRIYLDRGLPDKTFKKTVVHELTHAFLYSYDFDLNDENKDVEETVCEFTENHLKKILKTAAKIVKAWKADMIIKALL